MGCKSHLEMLCTCQCHGGGAIRAHSGWSVLQCWDINKGGSAKMPVVAFRELESVLGPESPESCLSVALKLPMLGFLPQIWGLQRDSGFLGLYF